MTDIFFKILWNCSKILRQRYPDINSIACEDAYYHINFYLIYGLLISFFASIFSHYVLLLNIPLFIQAVYRETIADGHLKRIYLNTETYSELLDFKADLITRLSPFIILMITWLIMAISKKFVILSKI